MLKRFLRYVESPVSIAPLASFRILFGAIMLVSVLRFMLNGWVKTLYVDPIYYFTYWGFEWVKPVGESGMTLVFVIMAFSAACISLGFLYRINAILFFLAFTYVELLDKTNYLNHYYFVTLVAFLLILVPAHRKYSIDSLIWPGIVRHVIPRWMIGIFRMQLGMVYFYAGLAKLNPDWLFRALPLKIWLPAKSHLPVMGGLLKTKLAAYIFSWAGALYDLTVPFFLLWRPTRWMAYFAVITFHILTWWLFPIGMFPFIMILSTLIFFPANTHERILNRILGRRWENMSALPKIQQRYKLLSVFLGIYMLIQILLPFRFVLYPGKLFWTEEGYRFSWRVMLMEKAGYAIFKVRDPQSGQSSEVINSQYLTPNQEKMMATQPDMILQFAHFLWDEYQQKGIQNPEVYANVYVTLNGSGSRPFIDPTVNLAEIKEGWNHKSWILPFGEPQSLPLQEISK